MGRVVLKKGFERVIRNPFICAVGENEEVSGRKPEPGSVRLRLQDLRTEGAPLCFSEDLFQVPVCAMDRVLLRIPVLFSDTDFCLRDISDLTGIPVSDRDDEETQVRADDDAVRAVRVDQGFVIDEVVIRKTLEKGQNAMSPPGR